MEQHELVDKNGNKTGKIVTHIQARNPENIPEGYYMPVVGVVIMNNNNEILLQKRSQLKSHHPGKWGICGGKMDLDENTIDTAVRETLEEIGIRLQRENLKLVATNVVEQAYFTVYYIKQEVEIDTCKLQVEEVDKVQYFKIEELEKLDNEGFEWLESLKQVLQS